MKTNQRMLTLIPMCGKENEAREILERAVKTIGMQDAAVVYGGERTIHYHVIGKDITPYIKETEEWPGIVKRQIITESQAQEMKQTHEQYVIYSRVYRTVYCDREGVEKI